MSESTVDIRENASAEELREAAAKFDRIAENLEAEARQFRNRATWLRAEGGKPDPLSTTP